MKLVVITPLVYNLYAKSFMHIFYLKISFSESETQSYMLERWAILVIKMDEIEGRRIYPYDLPKRLSIPDGG